MRQFPVLVAGAARRLIEHPALRAAARHFSGRAALTALCFFVIATAGIRQMDASYRQSIVKEGRYSLVESVSRPWRAADLRVGWSKNGAYIGFADYVVLETLALGGVSLSFLAFLTPALWFAARSLVRESKAEDGPEDDGAQSGTAESGGWLFDPAE